MPRNAERAPTADNTALLAGVLFVCALLYGAQQIQRSVGVDYYQFWITSRAAASPARDTLYGVERSRQVGREGLERALLEPESSRFRRAAEWNQRTNPDLLDPISTPFYYAAIGALTSGSYEWDFLVYQSLGSLAFVLGLVGLCRMHAYPWQAALLVAALVLLFFGPLQSDVQAANVNRLQLGGLVAALAALRRGHAQGVFLGGALLALLVVFKPNLALVPALLLASWALRGRTSDLRHGSAGLAAGTLLGVAVGSWRFASMSCWLDWLAVMQRSLGKPYPLENFNVSAASLVHSLWSIDVSMALTLLLLAGFAICLFRGGRVGRRSGHVADSHFDQDARAVGVGCVIPLVSLQIAWDHYFLLALPLLLRFLRPGTSRLERALSLAALALLAQSPLNSIIPLGTAVEVAIAFAVATSTLLSLSLREAARA